MDTFRSLELDFEKDLACTIQGEILAVEKDKKSTATLFLEKITDQKLSKCKFVLHVKFWNLSTLLSDITTGSESKTSTKLSLPLSFFQGKQLFDLGQLLDGVKPSLSLNCDSSLIAINMGFGVFCAYFEVNEISLILHKSNSEEKQKLILPFYQVTDQVEPLKISKIKWHPSIQDIITYTEELSSTFRVLDLQDQQGIYEIDVSEKQLSSGNRIVDWVFAEDSQKLDFGVLSMFLMAENGALYLVSPLIFPRLKISNQTQSHFLSLVDEYIKKASKSNSMLHLKANNRLQDFMNKFQGCFVTDQSGQFLSVKKERALSLINNQDIRESVRLIGPIDQGISENIFSSLARNLTTTSSDNGSYFSRLVYMPLDNCHLFVLIKSSGELRILVTSQSIFPEGLWMTRNQTFRENYESIRLGLINIGETTIFNDISLAKIKSLPENQRSIQIQTVNFSIFTKIATEIVEINLKWISRVLRTFFVSSSSSKDKVYFEQIKSNLQSNTVFMVHSSEYQIQYFNVINQNQIFTVCLKGKLPVVKIGSLQLHGKAQGAEVLTNEVQQKINQDAIDGVVEPEFKYVLEEIEKSIPKPAQMYATMDELQEHLKKFTFEPPKVQDMLDEKKIATLDETLSSKYTEIAKFQENIDYRANLLRQQILAIKDQNSTFLARVGAKKQMLADMENKFKQSQNKNLQLRERLMKILGVMDGLIKPEELKSNLSSLQAKSNQEMHSRMSESEKKIYDELCMYQADLVPESIQYLKQELKKGLSLDCPSFVTKDEDIASSNPVTKLKKFMERLSKEKPDKIQEIVAQTQELQFHWILTLANLVDRKILGWHTRISKGLKTKLS